MISPGGTATGRRAASILLGFGTILAVAAVPDALFTTDTTGPLTLDDISYVRPDPAGLTSLSHREVTVEVTSSIALDAVDPYDMNADEAARSDFKAAATAILKHGGASNVVVRNVEATETEDAVADAPSAVVSFSIVVSTWDNDDAEAIAMSMLSRVQAALTVAIRDNSLEEVLRAMRSATSHSLDAARVRVAESLELVQRSTATFLIKGDDTAVDPVEVRQSAAKDAPMSTETDRLLDEWAREEFRRLQDASFSFSFSFVPTTMPSPMPTPMPTPVPSTIPIPAPTGINLETLESQACSQNILNYGHKFDKSACNLLDDIVF